MKTTKTPTAQNLDENVALSGAPGMRSLHEIIGAKFSDKNLNIKKVTTIEDYDGPLIAVARVGDTFFFLLWRDSDAKATRWLIFEASPENVVRYLKGDLCLLSVVQSNKGNDYYLQDYTSDRSEELKMSLKLYEIPGCYMPRLGAFHDKTDKGGESLIEELERA